MADMTRIKGRIAETIYPNGTGAITAESHQALLLEMVDDINAKKADKEEVTTVAESVSMLSQEVESNYNNLTESLDALEEKVDNLPQGGGNFNAEGNYPLLHVGLADDLAGRGESVPASFGFRASGGKSIKDGRAYIKRIKGNSVVWNNQSENSLSQDSPSQSLPIGSKLVQGHNYLMLAESITNCVLYLYYNIDGSNVRKMFDNTYSFFTSDASISANGLISGQGALWWYVLVQDSTVEYSANNVRLIDLTQMFQAGNEPTTIEEFNARVATLGVDMNAYNEGQVIHCNTESIKSVGDNAWDEKWEEGYYDVNNGQKKPAENLFRSVNHFRILPNNEYYLKGTGIRILYYDANMNYISYEIRSNGIITSPPNACYASIFGEKIYYSTDIMITLVHSGWKQDTDAGYQPYWQDTLPLPIIRKYFPQGMKSAGSAHDEIRYNKASGKWEAVQRIGDVDLGSLEWTAFAVNGHNGFRSNKNNLGAKPISATNGVTCSLYTNAGTKWYSEGLDKCIVINNGYYIASADIDGVAVRDTSYTDVATFKAAMQGVMLYYELAEPIVTELDAEDQNFRDYYNVADFGTEQSQSNVPSAAFSADIIYQFNAVDMIREHEIEITELQSIIATMQEQLTALTNGGQ